MFTGLIALDIDFVAFKALAKMASFPKFWEARNIGCVAKALPVRRYRVPLMRA